MVPRGSRNSEPRGTKRTRNGDPAAMLFKLSSPGSEGNRALRGGKLPTSGEPEGSKGPEGEQVRESRPEYRIGTQQRVVGDNLPRTGKPEVREGAQNRTG